MAETKKDLKTDPTKTETTKEETKPDTPDKKNETKPASTTKSTKPAIPLKFIAFFKQRPESNWTLYPQMFVSKKQATKKLDLVSDPNEIHIIEVDLPE